MDYNNARLHCPYGFQRSLDSHMKWVHTLIDYDNAIEVPERTAPDVAVNLAVLVPRLTAKLGALVPDSQELLCRLYGGWMTLDSQLTQRAVWLLAELSNFRRKTGPHRLRLTMAREIIARSDLTLIGTYQNNSQKMVDGMLSVDVIELSAEKDTSLAFVSDDDDFVPAIIAASETRLRGNPIHLLRRRRPADSAANDALLRACNVVISEY